MQQDSTKLGWLDTRVSLQRLLAGVLAALLAAFVTVGTWAYGIEKRVTANESQDQEQEKHFSRIEGAITEQRSDTRDALRGISQDLKDLSNKFDQLKDQMIANSVANRPDIGKWSKP